MLAGLRRRQRLDYFDTVFVRVFEGYDIYILPVPDDLRVAERVYHTVELHLHVESRVGGFPLAEVVDIQPVQPFPDFAPARVADVLHSTPDTPSPGVHIHV